MKLKANKKEVQGNQKMKFHVNKNEVPSKQKRGCR